LSDSARRWPDRVAVGTAAGDRKATYRDLRALTRDLAAKLDGLGISRTDTVAIFSDNSMEFVLALFGVLFLGAAAAPLNPDLAPAEISDDDKAEAWWRSSSRAVTPAPGEYKAPTPAARTTSRPTGRWPAR